MKTQFNIVDEAVRDFALEPLLKPAKCLNCHGTGLIPWDLPCSVCERSGMTTNAQALFVPEVIRKELPLRHCSYVIAREYGGPLTQAVLDTIALRTREIYDARIDVRRHLFKKNEVASLDGDRWHCEFPIMSGRYYTFNRERDLATHNYTFISGAPLTEFVDEPIELHNLDVADPHLIDILVRARDPRTRIVELGRVYIYNATTLHRARPWQGDQPTWRYFFRATFFLAGDPAGAFENIIGDQVEARSAR